MKRRIFAILAALTVFAMIGCNSDTDPGPEQKGETFTVTFDSDGGSAVAAKTGIKSGEKIAAPANPTKDANVFEGWFIGDKAWDFAKDTVTDNITLKAKWTPFDKATQAKVTFKLKDGVSSDIEKVVKKGEALGDNFPAAPTRPTHDFVKWTVSEDGTTGDDFTKTTVVSVDITVYAQWKIKEGLEGEIVTVNFDSNGGSDVESQEVEKGSTIALPNEPTREGYKFVGWFKDEEFKEEWDFEEAVDEDITLYAQWEEVTEIPPPVAVDKEPGIEVITLENAWQAVYQFKLPAGKKWEDYEKITVEYMIPDEATLNAENGARAIRLYGNYKPANFKFITTAKGSKVAVYDYNEGNGDWILADAGGGWKSIATFFTEQGITAGVGDWFTITYPIDGSKKNGSYKDVNKPADNATGPFYFGLGIAGQGTGTTSVVKNVTLVGYVAADNVIATPAYFKEPDGSDEYPAFTGYGNLDGSAGEDGAKRKIVTSLGSSVTKEAGIEQITLENAWQAVYQFKLPAGKKWEDYEKITVKYMIPDAATLNAENGARAIRLYGNFKPTNFKLITTDKGSKLAVYDYNEGNGDWILADAGGGWKSIATFFTEQGITAGVGDWFTITYPIDGSKKNGSYKEINKPAAAATGPFYFGLGIAGQGTGTTSLVQDVTLVGYVAADSVTATPAYFKNILDSSDPTEYPAFTGYGNLNGSAGEDGAKRKIVTAGQVVTPIVKPKSGEKITLENAWQAVYTFTLPDGKKWEDYEKITVEYMIDDATILNAENGARAIRLYGNFKPVNFKLITTTAGNKLAVYDYNNGNGDWILADAGGGWKSIATFFTEQGITAGVGDWFTITYPIDGSKKNGSYKDVNKPADNATGPFYFGLGIAGQGTGTTSHVKNVTLVGYVAADNVIATPTYFKNTLDASDTAEYPAYTGYGNVDGSAGEDGAARVAE